MMHSYPFQLPITEHKSKKELDIDRLEQFKNAIESHVQRLTAEVQTLATNMEVINAHANWIEPRLHDFLAFNQWMEKAHPDIIEAYKTSTKVARTLDKANAEEVFSESTEQMGAQA